ncbi:NAD(P)H-binding protein [Spirosoma fluminis]
MTGITLLLGATAGTGYEAAQKLLFANQPIRIIARNPEKARKLFGQPRAELVIGDLTTPNEAFYRAFQGVETILFTAAVPPGFASEAKLCAVDYGGLVAALDAARKVSFRGRFVYMSTIGLQYRTWFISLLNLIKTNVIHWRLEAEKVVMQSGLPYTIVRAGVLRNQPEGRKPIQLFPHDLPITLSTQIGRADMAYLFILFAQQEAVRNQVINAAWGGDGLSVLDQLSRLAYKAR